MGWDSTAYILHRIDELTRRVTLTEQTTLSHRKKIDLIESWNRARTLGAVGASKRSAELGIKDPKQVPPGSTVTNPNPNPNPPP